MANLHSLDMRRPESTIDVAKAVCALPPNEKSVCIRFITLFTNHAFCVDYTNAGDIPFDGLTKFMDAWEAEHETNKT